jgi:hypothetical protein
MFAKLQRGYRKFRFLPKYIVGTLNDIAAGVTHVRREQTESLLLLARTQRDLQTSLSAFCDDLTNAMLALKSGLDAAQAQSALVERRLRTVEATLRSQAADRQAEQDALARVRATVEAIHQDRSSQPGETQAILNAISGQAAAYQQATDARLAGLAATLDAALKAAAAPPLPATDEANAIAAALHRLSDHVDREVGRIDHLSMTVAEQARFLPSWVWTEESAARVRTILALIEPVSVLDVAKIRVGRETDGGYVMLDSLANAAAALSLGIADDVSWDKVIAAHGLRVLQFDCSVCAPPEPDPQFAFEQLRIAAADDTGAITLQTILRTRLGEFTGPLILKIDIEGAEWEVFEAADPATLGRFDQILCEFHQLDRLHETDFGDRARTVFAKLAATHAVFHVHGNNCSSFANVGNVVIPQSLEVSFALRANYRTAPSAELFPTPLDRPNQPGRADLYLGAFRFAPPPHAVAPV